MNPSKSFNPTPTGVNNLISHEKFCFSVKTFFVGVNLSENCKFFYNLRSALNKLTRRRWMMKRRASSVTVSAVFRHRFNRCVGCLKSISLYPYRLLYWFYHTYTLAPSHTLVPSYLFHRHSNHDPIIASFVISFKVLRFEMERKVKRI